jgi:hypothetical protein
VTTFGAAFFSSSTGAAVVNLSPYDWNHRRRPTSTGMSMLTEKELARFEAKFSRGDGCWEWTASRRPHGYGQFNLRGMLCGAHRVAYEHYIGPIPSGLHVCHSCDNPICVRPDHLFLGTAAENQADCIAKGRQGDRGSPGGLRRGGKLDHHKVVGVRVACLIGIQQREVAGMFGISRNTVQRIFYGKLWAHLPPGRIVSGTVA